MSTAAENMTNRPAALPEVKGGVIAYLQLSNASAAAELYKKAFGATEVYRHPVDEQGRTMHIHLYINGGSVMLSDCYPEHGFPHRPAQGFSLMMQVTDIDSWWQRATAAQGVEVVMPLQEMFWGARYGEVRDPFGVSWAFNQPLS